MTIPPSRFSTDPEVTFTTLSDRNVPSAPTSSLPSTLYKLSVFVFTMFTGPKYNAWTVRSMRFTRG